MHQTIATRDGEDTGEAGIVTREDNLCYIGVRESIRNRVGKGKAQTTRRAERQGIVVRVSIAVSRDSNITTGDQATREGHGVGRSTYDSQFAEGEVAGKLEGFGTVDDVDLDIARSGDIAGVFNRVGIHRLINDQVGAHELQVAVGERAVTVKAVDRDGNGEVLEIDVTQISLDGGKHAVDEIEIDQQIARTFLDHLTRTQAEGQDVGVFDGYVLIGLDRAEIAEVKLSGLKVFPCTAAGADCVSILGDKGVVFNHQGSAIGGAENDLAATEISLGIDDHTSVVEVEIPSGCVTSDIRQIERATSGLGQILDACTQHDGRGAASHDDGSTFRGLEGQRRRATITKDVAGEIEGASIGCDRGRRPGSVSDIDLVGDRIDAGEIVERSTVGEIGIISGVGNCLTCACEIEGFGYAYSVAELERAGGEDGRRASTTAQGGTVGDAKRAGVDFRVAGVGIHTREDLNVIAGLDDLTASTGNNAIEGGELFVSGAIAVTVEGKGVTAENDTSEA